MAVLDRTVELALLPHSTKRWLPKRLSGTVVLPQNRFDASTFCSPGTFCLNMVVLAFPNP